MPKVLDTNVREDMILQLTLDVVEAATLAELRSYVKELVYQGFQELSDQELIEQIHAHEYVVSDFTGGSE